MAIQPLIPIYFSLLAVILSNFPELAPISRWIKGFEILLGLLAIFLICEEKFAESQGRPSLKKIDNRGVTSVKKPPWKLQS
jgi:hypothetical protein